MNASRSPVSYALLEIMNRFQLRQRDLAQVMEVSLDRVKNLRSGRATKLTQEEISHLIKKLNIRALWLTAREGNMTADMDEDDFQPQVLISSQEAEILTAFRALPASLRTAALAAVRAMAQSAPACHTGCADCSTAPCPDSTNLVHCFAAPPDTPQPKELR